MAMFTRSSILAIAFVLTAGSAAYAQSCPSSGASPTIGQFTTVSGLTLILPPITSLGCADIDKTLARIDSTRYRGNAPVPHNKADCPLLHYELQLAEENYNRCVITRKKMTGGLLLMKRSKSK